MLALNVWNSKFEEVEKKIEKQQEEIDTLKNENKILHLLLYDYVRNNDQMKDIQTDDINSNEFDQLIQHKNNSISKYSVALYKYLLTSRDDVPSLSNEVLLHCNSTTSNDVEFTNSIMAISNAKRLEYSSILCDTLANEINGTSTIREDCAIKAFSNMPYEYKNESLVQNLCDCYIITPVEDIMKKFQLSNLILRYSTVESTKIKKKISTSGLIEYIADNTLELQQYGSLGLILLAINNLLSDVQVVNSLPLNTLQSVVTSTIWHEDYADEEWKEMNKFEPYSIMLNICNSTLQRNVLSRSGLIREILDHIDLNNIICLRILLVLNRICPDEISEFTQNLKDVLDLNVGDKNFSSVASELLCSIAVGSFGKKKL
ncbi:Uncharacterized protein QTN25_010485 [Entamoeba marina]